MACLNVKSLWLPLSPFFLSRVAGHPIHTQESQLSCSRASWLAGRPALNQTENGTKFHVLNWPRKFVLWEFVLFEIFPYSIRLGTAEIRLTPRENKKNKLDVSL